MKGFKNVLFTLTLHITFECTIEKNIIKTTKYENIKVSRSFSAKCISMIKTLPLVVPLKFNTNEIRT